MDVLHYSPFIIKYCLIFLVLIPINWKGVRITSKDLSVYSRMEINYKF